MVRLHTKPKVKGRAEMQSMAVQYLPILLETILSRYNPYARVGEKISIHGAKCELSADAQEVAPGAANRR